MLRKPSSLVRLAVIAQLGALACLVVAFFFRNHLGFEAAFFNHDPGTLGNVSVFHVEATPWLIAAGVLLVVALALFLMAFNRRAAA